MSDNQSYHNPQIVAELSETEHRQLFEALKNPILLKYLNQLVYVNAWGLARSALPENVNDVKYLISHATTKGVLLCADTLLDLYKEGVAKYGASTSK